MFQEVEIVDNLSNAPTHKLDGFISADIEKFTSPAQNLPNQAEIIYVFSLFDRQKNPVGTLRIWGRGKSDKRFIINSVMRDAVELAIKDAMAQFMVAFEKHPRFKRWLIENGAIKDEK